MINLIFILVFSYWNDFAIFIYFVFFSNIYSRFFVLPSGWFYLVTFWQGVRVLLVDLVTLTDYWTSNFVFGLSFLLTLTLILQVCSVCMCVSVFFAEERKECSKPRSMGVLQLFLQCLFFNVQQLYSFVLFWLTRRLLEAFVLGIRIYLTSSMFFCLFYFNHLLKK